MAPADRTTAQASKAADLGACCPVCEGTVEPHQAVVVKLTLGAEGTGRRVSARVHRVCYPGFRAQESAMLSRLEQALAERDRHRLGPAAFVLAGGLGGGS